MSTKYPGGIITKNYVPPTTTSASGIWTLEQQEQAQQAGIWPFGGPFTYIEDVFSTWLYTGNGTSQTITNNIDLSTKGGMVWIKNRNITPGYDNVVYDTVRGTGTSKALYTDTADAQNAYPDYQNLTAFNTDGFSVGTTVNAVNLLNTNSGTFASWTFRKQPKFFDVVTYTGNGGSPQNIAHSLASVPGFLMIKRTDATEDWQCVARRSNGNYDVLVLNTTAAANPSNRTVAQVGLTSTTFDASAIVTSTNGATYVAYLFAHNAGGFGLTGTDNVISCGSFTQGSGNTAVTLGYEPQWVMIKSTDATGSGWEITDNMRAMPVTGSSSAVLVANLSNAESSSIYGVHATSTGFISNGYTSGSFIYIAIRRGPMKVPTTGTSVYNAIARTGTGANVSVTGVGFTPDFVRTFDRSGQNAPVVDRLRGNTYRLYTSATDAEAGPSSTIVTSFDMDGVSLGTYGQVNASATNYINHFFRRAPSFFDEVCFDGSNSDFNVTHNLGVVPELIIIKKRNSTSPWYVLSSYYPGGFGGVNDNYFTRLNLTNALTGPGVFFSGTITSTNIPMAGAANYGAGSTAVAYLFATCTGVSKVGSYTGNGTTQTINCGFTGGARFVLIKRTDSTGDWYVYDTARGMTVLTDPYLLFNDTAAEVATLGSVTTVSTGFALNSTILAAINVSSATYIFLAIA
jgi:hypothetical protein